MSNIWIDRTLLDEVSAEARALPRLRKNRNFHTHDEADCHRLIIAMEPGSYIRPHRHLSDNKDETLIVLRGALGVVFFDEEGAVVERAVMRAEGPTQGVTVPHGRFHTALSLEPGTVFFESKGGPYRPYTEAECAPWGPAEKEPQSAGYLRSLECAFGVEQAREAL